MLKIAGRYIVREFLLSFLVSFLFFFFIFVINVLLVRAEAILSKNVPLGDVMMLIIYSLPINILFTIPFSTLVGGLMAFGRLVKDNEVMAFRACGISIYKLFWPILAIGLVLSILAFIFNDIFLPLGNINLKTLLRKITLSNPGVELKPYSIKKYQNNSIITGNVNDNTIEDIIIIDTTSGNRKRIIMASYASMVENEEQKGVISLVLENVFCHSASINEKDVFEYSTADTMIYNLLLPDIIVDMVNPGPSEMSSVDVMNQIKEKEEMLTQRKMEQKQNLQRMQYQFIMQMMAFNELNEKNYYVSPLNDDEILRTYSNLMIESERIIEDSSLPRYRMEFHKKFAMSFSCIVFIIFAFSVGILIRRTGRFIGFGIGVVVSGIYWFMLAISFKFGVKLFIEPLISMWLPNMVILAFGIFFLILNTKR
jgi:lipopolysaccharide export system permease protein